MVGASFPIAGGDMDPAPLTVPLVATFSNIRDFK